MGESVRVSICTVCKHEFTPPSNWSKESPYCPPCRQIINKKYRDARVTADPQYHSRVRYWSKHGLYLEEVEAWITESGNRCAACGRVFDDSLSGRACIDHDHSCCPDGYSCHQCRRGLICSNCNVALGHVKDDTSTLRGLIQYLEGATNV